jgi:hypothetical protein
MWLALAVLAEGLLLDAAERGAGEALVNGISAGAEHGAARSRMLDPMLLELPARPARVSVPATDSLARLKRRTQEDNRPRIPRKRTSIKAVHKADRNTSVHFSTDEEIVNLGRTYHDNFVIVTAADYAFRGILVNWMARMHELRLDNYLVLCLDDELALFMDQIGRPCIHNNIGQKDIWLIRFQTAATLLDGGMNVLMSDTDAIWLKDPTDLLQGDIVASRGNMPEDVVSKFGATACMVSYIFAVSLLYACLSMKSWTGEFRQREKSSTTR